MRVGYFDTAEDQKQQDADQREPAEAFELAFPYHAAICTLKSKAFLWPRPEMRKTYFCRCMSEQNCLF